MQRILCRYSGKECEENRGVHQKSVTGRFRVRPDDVERVHRPVYGWAGKTEQIESLSKNLAEVYPLWYFEMFVRDLKIAKAIPMP